MCALIGCAGVVLTESSVANTPTHRPRPHAPNNCKDPEPSQAPPRPTTPPFPLFPTITPSHVAFCIIRASKVPATGVGCGGCMRSIAGRGWGTCVSGSEVSVAGCASARRSLPALACCSSA